MIARAVVTPKDGSVPVGVCNPRDEKVVMPKGAIIATLEPLEDSREIAAVEEKQWKKSTSGRAETKQNMLWELANGEDAESEKECFYGLLMEYTDVFAEGQSDYGLRGWYSTRFTRETTHQ